MNTNFKEKLVNDLTNKNLSPSSIKLYIGNLQRLNDENPLENLNFLYNIEEIKKKLEPLKLTTQRGYLIAISSVLEMYKTKSKKNLDIYKKYYDLMLNTNEKLKTIPSEKMTDTQAENWLNWQQIKDKFKSIEEEVNKFINNNLISKNKYNKLLEYIVLALYVYNEPRRNEYINMNIVKKYNNNLDENINYLSYDDNKFIFNKYKTSKKRGQETLNINEDLKAVIDKYFKFHREIRGKKINNKTNTPFLVNINGEALTSPNGITRILNKIFNKNISSSMLRHIYLTDLYGDTVNKMKETANKMGHSVQTQKEYIKEAPPPGGGG
jgi:integrase